MKIVKGYRKYCILLCTFLFACSSEEENESKEDSIQVEQTDTVSKKVEFETLQQKELSCYKELYSSFSHPEDSIDPTHLTELGLKRRNYLSPVYPHEKLESNLDALMIFKSLGISSERNSYSNYIMVYFDAAHTVVDIHELELVDEVAYFVILNWSYLAVYNSYVESVHAGEGNNEFIDTVRFFHFYRADGSRFMPIENYSKSEAIERYEIALTWVDTTNAFEKELLRQLKAVK